MKSIFTSEGEYVDHFDKGLQELLQSGPETAPGVFICACANAFSCEEDYCRSASIVGDCLREMCQAHPEYILDPQDDNQKVLKRIVEIGFANLRVSRLIEMGPFEVTINSIRALRPSRGASGAKGSIFEPFDPTKFNFTSPQASCLTMWDGLIAGRQATLIYNMFPFAKRHVSVLPEIKSQYPQFMTKDIHDWLWDALDEIGKGIDGMVCGYNSTAGYASVNHFHGHLALEPDGLPVMENYWAHNGGTKSYPANTLPFSDKLSCWQALEYLIAQDIAHNMLLMPGRAYLYPRSKQNPIMMPEWSGGIAWSEFSGRMVVTDDECLGQMSWVRIEEALGSISLI